MHGRVFLACIHVPFNVYAYRLFTAGLFIRVSSAGNLEVGNYASKEVNLYTAQYGTNVVINVLPFSVTLNKVSFQQSFEFFVFKFSNEANKIK